MAAEAQLLDCVELNPSKPATSCVIWLHGLGADSADFSPIVPELRLPHDLAVRFIFPNAPHRPVTINNGYMMRAWYDIDSLDIHQRSDLKGILNSNAAIAELIKHEERRGIPADKIIIGGFSQGAVIALTTVLQYPKKLAGVMALSGYLPNPDQVFANASEANRETPIFLAHGTEDPVVPFMLGEMARDFLRQHHYKVDWHAYEMPHSVCGQEILDIGKWIAEGVS